MSEWESGRELERMVDREQAAANGDLRSGVRDSAAFEEGKRFAASSKRGDNASGLRVRSDGDFLIRCVTRIGGTAVR